ncbi:hypothetical protein IFM89_002835 [Coptis chinensis]|uniref:NADH:quinone oxidoreductase/Mrp antiporter transmembrane domain-containing protein n=1 Tax=Coptis chinensis TaxID=261450 RepID=A0A835HVR4_9MAGN|nr:hypothetical protein IFM89_002835 [Coptis chinensis]
MGIAASALHALSNKEFGSARKVTATTRKEGVHVARCTATESSIASMILGRPGAMAQTKVKRPLAHSSIGHVGYIRTGFSCGTIEGIQSLLIVSESLIVQCGKQTTSDAGTVGWKLLRSTGKAAWLVGTTLVIIVVPLVITMDREQQFAKAEQQSAHLLGGTK